jgi:hypothetical protein
MRISRRLQAMWNLPTLRNGLKTGVYVLTGMATSREWPCGVAHREDFMVSHECALSKLYIYGGCSPIEIVAKQIGCYEYTTLAWVNRDYRGPSSFMIIPVSRKIREWFYELCSIL